MAGARGCTMLLRQAAAQLLARGHPARAQAARTRRWLSGPTASQQVAVGARAAALRLATLPLAARNDALAAIVEELEAQKDHILAENAADMAAASGLVEAGELSAANHKRLELTDGKWDELLGGVRSLIPMADPIGAVSYATELDEGLDLYRVSCPLGVVCVIFEARPDAAVQIAALGIKSANAVILKGGAEAARSNAALVGAMRDAIARVPLPDGSAEGFPADSINLVEGRAAVGELMSMNEHIDLIIPRGSNELVQSIQRSTSIPVMGHADGICHIYVDAAAEVETAVAVVVDGKTQYPAVCNATEALLVHGDAAAALLPRIGAALIEKGVTLHCDPEAQAILASAGEHVQPAQPDAFDTEWLTLDLSVKVVSGVQEAVQHINQHGSGHTDVILSEDCAAAEYFLAHVDSATVGHNASTRFADGFRYGFGAEVGVSTNKTHARGPVGLEGLTIYKYRLLGRATGDGRKHVVGQYGAEGREFRHARIESEAHDLAPH